MNTTTTKSRYDLIRELIEQEIKEAIHDDYDVSIDEYDGDKEALYNEYVRGYVSFLRQDLMTDSAN